MALSRLTIDLAVGLAGFESDMGRAANITQREVKKMEREFSRFAAVAGAALGATVVAGFGQAVRAAAEFERSMAEVATLLDDTSSLDSMTESVKDLAKEFGQAPAQQAAALYQIISSGAEAGAEAISILDATNKLALGGMTDLRTAADGLTSVLNAYGDEAGSASEISDKFFAAMKAGKTTVGELAGAIGPVISVAKELGVSFDELIAAGSTLTLSGLSTSQAFNSLKAAFANVIKPSKEAEETAKALGINFSAAAIESQTFEGFLQELQRAAGGNVEVMSKLFGSVEGLNAALALTGSSADAFGNTLGSVRNAANETQKAVEDVKNTASQAFNELAEVIRVQLIDAGSQINQVLVPAIRALAASIDEIIIVAKSFALVIGVNIVAKMLIAAQAAGTLAGALGVLRVAFFAVGGPIGVLTGLVAGVQIVLHRYRQEAEATGRAVEGLASSVRDLVNARKDEASVSSLLAQQEPVRRRLLDTEVQLAEVQEKLAQARQSALSGTLAYQNTIKRLAAEEERLLDAQGEAIRELANTNRRVQLLRVQGWEPLVVTAARVTDSITGIGQSAANAAGGINTLATSFREADQRIRAIRSEFEEWAAVLDEIGREQEDFNQRLQRLRDIASPVAALVRQFEADQRDLNRAVREGIITEEERQRILNELSNTLGQAAAATQDASDEFDKWAEAGLEAVRILERAFTSAWQNIRGGFSDLLDGLLDGFETLLASMLHQFFTSPLVKSLSDFFQKGTKFDFGTLGTALGGIAGFGLGSLLGGGGEFASLGSAFGTLFGEAAFSAIFPSLFAGLGSFGGPIGSIIGGLLGGLVGGLFDDAPDFELQLVGSGLIGDPALGGRTGPFVSSRLGGFNVTNTGDFDSETVQQLVQGLVDFDNTLAQFLSAGQLEQVTELLKQWGTELDGAAVSLEAFISSRLDQIQFALEGAVLAWVNSAESLEDEIGRTAAAFLTENLFDQRPDLFQNRTQQEFLAVVEAFQDGTETITDAFNEVIQILDQVVALTTFLEDFAGSDLQSDFNAILAAQDRTIGEALALTNSQLMDAVANFDGSIESLQNIAALVSTVREGEIAYLSQLDQLQKGLNASLNDLRADILGLTEGPKTGAQLFNEARQLAFDIQDATSAEEVAALQQQFNSLIRGIGEEDAIRFQSQILQLIDSFQAAANDTIDRFRDDALDNADAMRDLVDVFRDDIGDPLDIIAATNERAATALEILAGGTPALPGEEPVPPEDDNALLVESIVTANAQQTEAQNRIMQIGLSQIAISIERGSQITAAAMVDAMRSANFNYQFVVANDSLVTS